MTSTPSLLAEPEPARPRPRRSARAVPPKRMSCGCSPWRASREPKAPTRKGGASCFWRPPMSEQLETFAAFLRRYRDVDDDETGEVHRVSFAEAALSGDDPLHILKYLSGLGFAINSLDDLLQINADETEDEIHCYRVAEGVAVSVASDGVWLLFEP